jgi:short-subunit dehydrogenase
MIRAALPRLKAGVQPLIVNVSSILGRRGFPTQSAYCASKFALQGLSDAIRAELDRMGIRVLVVNPGVTRTDFAEHEIGPRQRSPFVHREGMRVEDVSGAIVEAIRRDRVELTLTWEGRGLVILNRLFPSLAEWVIRRHLRKRFSEPG